MLFVCGNDISAIAVAAGLPMVLYSCNSGPIGCPLYTSAAGTVVNVTMEVYPSSKKLKYAVLIDWSVCTQKMSDGDGTEWMLAVVKRFPVGRQEQVWIPKPYTILKTCFPDCDARNSDREFEMFVGGMAFLALALVMMIVTAVIVYRAWKSELERPSRPSGWPPYGLR